MWIWTAQHPISRVGDLTWRNQDGFPESLHHPGLARTYWQKGGTGLRRLCQFLQEIHPRLLHHHNPHHTTCQAETFLTVEIRYAFDTLKKLFTLAPGLRHPDPFLPYVLEVDGSEVATGAVISQHQGPKNLLHPMAFTASFVLQRNTMTFGTENCRPQKQLWRSGGTSLREQRISYWPIQTTKT